MQYNPIENALQNTERHASRLVAVISSLDGVVVALSGGVDSAVVAKAAKLALGDKAMAVTADSPSVPRSDIDHASRLAKELNLPHRIISTNEFQDPNYLKNGGDRCYFCKSELYSVIERKLPELGMKYICSGANKDDLGDYRPGLQAAKEHGIRHPLQEAGLGKEEVRAIAKLWGLEVWNKPASPCLSSRIAPGLEVTQDRTRRIEKAEIYIKDLGFEVCRVRLHHGELARLELPAKDLPAFLQRVSFQEVAKKFKELGFLFVSLDMEGMKSGGLNSLVPLEIMKKYKTAESNRGEE